MTQVADPSPEGEPWELDGFVRKPLADYLTASIAARFAAVENESRTVALDADWGAGKTFFVREWIKDLRAQGYPCVYFDAWKNDSSDDPSVVLMATILEGLDEWKGKLPLSEGVPAKVRQLTESAVKSLRSALLPAAAVVAKGVLKKVTGVAVNDVMDVVQRNTGDDLESAENEQVVDDALDRLFEKALASHRERATSLESFRASLQSVLNLIAEHAGAKSTYFVFVDELDRCRPSYAVKLLEEVKHIFGVPGLAYVVSTNVDQLQNSVRAAYGADFDGRRYLRRMFDKEYALPEPDVDRLVQFSLGKIGFIDQTKVITGLPRVDDFNTGTAWSLVARGMFPTDIRAQLQAIDLLSEVVSTMGASSRIHFMWLSYLVALYIVDRDSLQAIIRDEVGADSRAYLGRTMKQQPSIGFDDYSLDPFGRSPRRVVISLLEILDVYLRLSRTSNREIYEFVYSGDNRRDFPDSLAEAVADDIQQAGGASTPNPLRGYALLVFNAGRLTA